MHQAVVMQLASQRLGTAATKTRGLVRGGGRKPWRQKGTGRARAGSTRSPIWVGGGTAFGPQPRSYSFSMPRKARRLAIKSASVGQGPGRRTAGDGGHRVIAEPKTKTVVSMLDSLKVGDDKALIIMVGRRRERREVVPQHPRGQEHHVPGAERLRHSLTTTRCSSPKTRSARLRRCWRNGSARHPDPPAYHRERRPP